MPIRLSSYLRTFRKRAGLSQDEVAFLLGSRRGARVSDHERAGKQPTLKTVLAYEAIFRIPVRELFAGLYRKVEKTTAARARRLARKLTNERLLKRTPRKLATLQALEAECAPHGNKRRESPAS